MNLNRHSISVSLFNTLAALKSCVGVKDLDLDYDVLLETARKETGLKEMGGEDFRPCLEELLKSIRTEARLNRFGRHVVPRRFVRLMKSRLWCNAYLESHPEVLNHPIVAPVVIVGPARSGTTRLQRLLSVDTRFRHLKAWEGFNPAPRPGWPDGGKGLRQAETAQILALRRKYYPGADRAHPMEADWAEEEILLLDHAFSGLSPIIQYHVPSYCAWFLRQNRDGAYRFMANLLRLVSASSSESGNRPWILKTPQHMLDLASLHKIFPDARFVVIHRDPLKTVGSTLSLAWHHSFPHTERPRREMLKDVWLDVCSEMAARVVKGREGLAQERQLDVYYEDMNRDWQSVLRRIYEFLGVEFTAAVAASMGAWLQASSKAGRHGGHRYGLAEFGLTEADVDARLAHYRNRYAIPYEGR